MPALNDSEGHQEFRLSQPRAQTSQSLIDGTLSSREVRQESKESLQSLRPRCSFGVEEWLPVNEIAGASSKRRLGLLRVPCSHRLLAAADDEHRRVCRELLPIQYWVSLQISSRVVICLDY